MKNKRTTRNMNPNEKQNIYKQNLSHEIATSNDQIPKIRTP